jgi:hypothetical protein
LAEHLELALRRREHALEVDPALAPRPGEGL